MGKSLYIVPIKDSEKGRKVFLQNLIKYLHQRFIQNDPWNHTVICDVICCKLRYFTVWVMGKFTCLRHSKGEC